MSRHPALLNQDDSIIVVVDIQQRLLAAMSDAAAGDLVMNAVTLLKAANHLAIPQLVTEQYPRGLGPTVSELSAHIDIDAVLDKTAFSCAKVPEFMAQLEASGRKQVVLIGMEAHICIVQTALDLSAQGYHVHIVEEGVCSRNSNHKRHALQRMAALGITITNTESVVFEWLADASHTEFKTISKLVI